MNRAFGLLREDKVPEDHKFSAVARTVRNFPSYISYRDQMGVPLDQGAKGACHDDQTEVLTDDGWVLFADLRGHEKLASVDPRDSGIVFSEIENITKYKHKGEMIHFKHNSLNAIVTKDHKMLVRKFDNKKRVMGDEYELISADKIGWYCGLMNSVQWKGRRVAKFSYSPVRYEKLEEEISLNMDDFLFFLGVFIAEGTLSRDQKKYHSRFQIAACKPEAREVIMRNLKDLGLNVHVYKDRYVVNNKGMFDVLKDMGFYRVKAYQKRVPKFVFELCPSQIERFLEGYCLGDGCIFKAYDNYMRSFYTSSPGLADDVQRLLLLTGKWASISKRTKVGGGFIRGRLVTSKRPQYVINEWAKKNLSIDREKHSEIINYDGWVYCAEVKPYHTLITRRGYKMLISGNCVSCALAKRMEWQENEERKVLDTIRDNNTHFKFSPDFIYDQTQVHPGGGSYPKNALSALQKQGITLEHLYPYKRVTDKHKAKFEASGVAIDSAKRFKIERYVRLDSLEEMIQSLSTNGPVPVGGDWLDGWDGSNVLHEGMGRARYAHMYLIVGSDTGRGLLECMNSWGCYDQETELLTEDGFKKFHELKGEKVATLDTNGNLEYQLPTNYFEYDYDGELYRFKSRKVDLLVTPNHNMHVSARGENIRFRKIKAEDINWRDVAFKRDANWPATNVEYFSLPSVTVKTNGSGTKVLPDRKIKMDTWLKFFGLWISEGSLGNTKLPQGGHTYQVSISQKKKKGRKYVENVLNELGFKFSCSNISYEISSFQLYDYLKKFGKCNEKYIPGEFLSLGSENLIHLYESLMVGDGSNTRCINGSYKVTYYTTSKRLCDNFQEICLKLGYCTTVYKDDRVGEKNSNGHNYNHICYQIRIQNTSKKNAGDHRILNYKKKLEKYKGKVYCVEVPNHLLFIRRNGKTCWCGNSDWGDNGFFYLTFSAYRRHVWSSWGVYPKESALAYLKERQVN